MFASLIRLLLVFRRDTVCVGFSALLVRPARYREAARNPQLRSGEKGRAFIPQTFFLVCWRAQGWLIRPVQMLWAAAFDSGILPVILDVELLQELLPMGGTSMLGCRTAVCLMLFTRPLPSSLPHLHFSLLESSSLNAEKSSSSFSSLSSLEEEAQPNETAPAIVVTVQV